jgi:hypothetical protein
MKKILTSLVLLCATGLTHAQYFQHLYWSSTSLTSASDGHNVHSPDGHFITGFEGATGLVTIRTDFDGLIPGSPYFSSRHLIQDGNGTVNVYGAKSVELAGGNLAIAGSYVGSQQGIYLVDMSATGTISNIWGFTCSLSLSFIVNDIIRSQFNSQHVFICGHLLSTGSPTRLC